MEIKGKRPGGENRVGENKRAEGEEDQEKHGWTGRARDEGQTQGWRFQSLSVAVRDEIRGFCAVSPSHTLCLMDIYSTHTHTQRYTSTMLHRRLLGLIDAESSVK